MRKCPICNKNVHEVNEWRHCLQNDNQLICGEHCRTCGYKGDPGDILHCRYSIVHKEITKNKEKERLAERVKTKRRNAKELYKKAKWKEADKLIKDAETLEKQLRSAR